MPNVSAVSVLHTCAPLVNGVHACAPCVVMIALPAHAYMCTSSKWRTRLCTFTHMCAVLCVHIFGSPRTPGRARKIFILVSYCLNGKVEHAEKSAAIGARISWDNYFTPPLSAALWKVYSWVIYENAQTSCETSGILSTMCRAAAAVVFVLCLHEGIAIMISKALPTCTRTFMQACPCTSIQVRISLCTKISVQTQASQYMHNIVVAWLGCSAARFRGRAAIAALHCTAWPSVRWLRARLGRATHK